MQPDSELMSRIRNVLRFRTKGMSISEIARVTGMNRNSVAKYLEMLLLTGQVERHAVGSAKVYTLSRRLPISQVLSCSSGCIVVLDSSRRIIDVSDQYLSYAGLTREEVVSERIDRTSLPLLDTEEVNEILAGDGENGERTGNLAITRDGELLRFRVKAVPTVLEGGETGTVVQIEDITGQIEAEERLNLQEKSMQGFIEGQTELICSFTPDTRHIFVNDAYCLFFGRTKEDLINHRFRPRIHPDDRERVGRHFASLTPDQPRGMIEHRILHPDGRVCWVEWSDRAIYDGNNHLVGFQSVGRDITPQKEAEQSLRDAVRKLEEIIDFLPDATFVIDEQGAVIAWNRAIEEMTGKRKEDMLGKGNEAYSPLFYGMKRPLLANLVNAGEAEIAELYPIFWREKESLLSETYCPYAFHGRGAHLRVSASLLYDHTGRIAGAVESLRNITRMMEAEEELQKNREKFRDIADLSPHPAAITDRAGSFTYLSAKFTRLFGYTIDEIPGMDEWFMLAFSDPLERTAAQERWLRACSADAASLPHPEFRIRCADGTSRDVVVHPSHPEGNVRFIVFEDITDRRTADELRERSTKNLEFLSKTGTEFVEMSGETDIQEYIARRLHELAPGSIVFVGDIDEHSGELVVMGVEGDADRIDAIETAVGRPVRGLRFSYPPPSLRRLFTGKLQFVENGVMQLTGGALSGEVCRKIEEILTPGPILSAGFVWKNQLFGALAVVLPAGARFEDPGPLPVFIHQASVTLQKRRAEEELKRAHEQQTMKMLEYEHDLIRAHEILELEIAEHRYTNRELMKQREFTRLCYSLMDIAVIGIDRNGRILHCNPHASALLGYQSTEMRGRGWSDSFIPPPLKPEVDSLIEKVAQGGYESVVSLKPTITADGGELEMIWLFKRVKSEKGSKTWLLLLGERPPGAKVVALYRHLQAL